MAHLESTIRAVDGTEITVGIQATEGGQRHGDGGDVTTLDVAVWNHYGTRTAPPRPWLEQTAEQWGPAWLEAWAQAAAEVAETGDPGLYLMRVQQLAQVAVGDCKQVLTDLREPPNAESTIARKGSDNPLIDTSQLRDSHRAILTVGGRSEVVG